MNSYTSINKKRRIDSSFDHDEEEVSRKKAKELITAEEPRPGTLSYYYDVEPASTNPFSGITQRESKIVPENVVYDEGGTVFHKAIHRRKDQDWIIGAINALRITNAEDMPKEDAQGRTIRELAAQKGFSEVEEYLRQFNIRCDIFPDQKTDSSSSSDDEILIDSFLEEENPYQKPLVDEPASHDIVSPSSDYSSTTLLSTSSSSSNTGNCNVDNSDNAFHDILMRERQEIYIEESIIEEIKTLLKDPTQADKIFHKNAKGQTILKLANEKGYPKVVEWLMKYRDEKNKPLECDPYSSASSSDESSSGNSSPIRSP